MRFFIDDEDDILEGAVFVFVAHTGADDSSAGSTPRGDVDVNDDPPFHARLKVAVEAETALLPVKELLQRKLQVVLPLLRRSLLAWGDCRDTSWVVARLLLTRVTRSCGATCRNRGSVRRVSTHSPSRRISADLPGSSVSEGVSKFGVEVLVLEIVSGLFERWFVVWVGLVVTSRLVDASPAAAGTDARRGLVHRWVSHVFILSSVIFADTGVGLEGGEGRCATIVEVRAVIVAWDTGRRPASATGIRRTCALRSPPPFIEQGAVCVVDLGDKHVSRIKL